MQNETVYSTVLIRLLSAICHPHRTGHSNDHIGLHTAPFIYISHFTHGCSFTPWLIDGVNTITPHCRITLLTESQSVLGNLGVDF